MDLKRLTQSSTEDQPILAVVTMLIGLMALSLQDGLGKLLSSHLSLWQFQTTRAVFNIGLTLLIASWTMRGARLLPTRIRPVFIRSVFHVMALMFFFGGAPFLTMAEMAGGLYTFPLFVAVLGAIFLGENVGLRRVLAIAAGFCGTLLVIKPGTDAFRLVGLMPVAAGFNYAIFIIITRRFCRSESPVVLTLFSNVMILSVGVVGSLAVAALTVDIDVVEQFPFLLSEWRPFAFWIVATIAVCAVFNVIGNICMSKAYQSAESSFLAPFDYSYLIFASFWGLVIWGDVPDRLTLLGMALIAAAGIYVAWRERRLRLEAASTRPV